MSLKVWLPLDGDLRNLGCSNIEFINNNVTFNTSGKIGLCAEFNGSNSCLLSNNFEIGNIWSYGMWVYSATSSRGWEGVLILNNDGKDSDIQLGMYAYPGGNRIQNTANGQYNSNITTFTYGQWNHFLSTFDGSLLKTYLNGVLVDTKTITNNLLNRTNLTIGARCRGSSHDCYFQGKLNDIRIYDHCLSAAEVHEIAQGLVLHYKLDNMKIKTGTNLVTGITAGGRTTKLTDGRIGVKTTGENKDTYFTINLSESITNGTRYFLSCDASGIPNNGYWYFPLGTQNNSALPFRIYNGHNEYSFVANDISWGENRLFMDDNNRQYWDGQASFWNFELYKEPSLEIEDSSGYGHNGAIIGDLISNSDTKRYSTSTRWNCSSPTDSSETGICYIQTPFTLTTPLQLTVAWWAKPENGYGDGTYHAAFCTSNNASRPTDYNTTALHHRDSGFDIYPSDGSGGKRLSFTYIRNEWHHYAITYDGTTAKSYKDGVLQTSVLVGTNKTLATFSQLYIGYSQAGGAKRKTLGNYSDFRIYCTPLLDNDIKLLYNIGMRVDNLGGVHTFEFDEISNEKLLKTGILQTNELEETSIQLARLQKDKGWLSSEFIEI